MTLLPLRRDGGTKDELVTRILNRVKYFISIFYYKIALFYFKQIILDNCCAPASS